ncbi:hypothetical protein ACFE04_021266 [Oxalis oulophora]
MKNGESGRETTRGRREFLKDLLQVVANFPIQLLLHTKNPPLMEMISVEYDLFSDYLEWGPALFFSFVIVLNFTFFREKLHLRSCRLLSGMSMYNIEISNSSYKISKWAMEMDNNMHL